MRNPRGEFDDEVHAELRLERLECALQLAELPVGEFDEWVRAADARVFKAIFAEFLWPVAECQHAWPGRGIPDDVLVDKAVGVVSEDLDRAVPESARPCFLGPAVHDIDHADLRQRRVDVIRFASSDGEKRHKPGRDQHIPARGGNPGGDFHRANMSQSHCFV